MIILGHNWYRQSYLTGFALICAFVSIGVIVSPAMALLSFLIEEPVFQSSQNEIWLIRLVFRYFPFLASIQIVYGIVMLVSSLYLIKRKEWARRTLMVIFALGMAFMLLMGISFVMQLFRLKVPKALPELQVIGFMMHWVSVIIALGTVMFWEAVMAAALWFLHSPPVKEECS